MIITARNNERGDARLKFLVIVLILGAIAYAGYQYVPVAYQSYIFKDLMQQKVDAAAALGHPAGWVTEQLTKSAPEYSVPLNANIESTKQNQRLEVRVQFTRPIVFPGYTYDYIFDHTAKSTDFLFK